MKSERLIQNVQKHVKDEEFCKIIRSIDLMSIQKPGKTFATSQSMKLAFENTKGIYHVCLEKLKDIQTKPDLIGPIFKWLHSVN